MSVEGREKVLFCWVSVCVQVLQLWPLRHWPRPLPRQASVGLLLHPERKAPPPIEHRHVSCEHGGGQESKHLVVERRHTAGQEVRVVGAGSEGGGGRKGSDVVKFSHQSSLLQLGATVVCGKGDGGNEEEHKDDKRIHKVLERDTQRAWLSLA